MNTEFSKSVLLYLGMSLSFFLPVNAATLEEAFRNPPDTTRPGCYWYWINDNISKAGITKDLEAMSRVGIGRAYIGLIYNHKGPNDTPVGSVRFMSDAWWEALQWAVKEADRCGVEIGFFNSPGWSQSGGPWIKPSQSMRYLASSETIIIGGKRIERWLPPPEVRTFPNSGGSNPLPTGDPFTAAEFQDVKLIAFRQPEVEARDLDMRQVKATSPGIKQLGHLLDGSTETSVKIGKQPQVIDFRLATPVPVQSLRIDPREHLYRFNCVVESADVDGSFRELTRYSEERGHQGPRNKDPILVPFPETRAQRFRVTLSASRPVAFSEIALSRRAVLAHYVRKQLGETSPSVRPPWDAYVWPGQSAPATGTTVNPRDVIDLSDKMNADGQLAWDAPKGRWIVMRIGMVPIGTQCHPASPEAVGLEVDKMNREHVRSLFDGMVGEFLRRTPAADRKALKYVIADSYETGPQNWTDGLPEKFEKRFGYSPVPFLPCLTGRVVDSPKLSSRFLWDWRRLVVELIAVDYVGGLRNVAAEHDLTLWLENYGHWGFPSEFLYYGSQSDQVGGEFWESNEPLRNVECRAAASCSHIYGKREVYAEAFTSNRNFKQSPADIKSWCDWVYGTGVNRLILHVNIHQPEENTPGIIQWFGTAFNRHNTWFEQSKAFIDYVRRCSVMLQAGRPVADVAYYIGESAPMMQGPREPELPDGYDFDYINSDVLIHRARVENGRITLPGGASYAVLVLPPQHVMRPDVIKAIRRLVHAGATVIGPAPETSPSLQDYPAADDQVRRIAADLWHNVDGKSIKKRTVGKGRICNGLELSEVLSDLDIPPDVKLVDGEETVCATAGAGRVSIHDKGGIVFKHRNLDDTDLYFLANTSDKPEAITVSLRSTGRQPWFWNALDGTINKALAFTQKAGRIHVPLHLDASESTFIVLKEAIGSNICGKAVSNTSTYREIAVLDEDWIVSFRGQDAPSKVKFDRLIDWSQHNDPAIRQFAGTAVYQRSFELRERETQPAVVLALGKVGVIATVLVNGEEAGTVWTTPWEIDITSHVHPGKNELTIHVANTWHNRLVADAALPLERRKSYVSQPYRFKSGAPPANAGLCGPVILRSKHSP